MTKIRLPERKSMNVTIGANIRQTRLNSKVTSKELSKKLGIGLQQLQKYESGANRLSASMLIQVSSALKVRVTDLLPNMEKELGAANSRLQNLEMLHAQIIEVLDDLNIDGLKSLLNAAVAIRDTA